MFDYSTLPAHMQAPTRLYIEEGIPGGDFFTALFANDLLGAMGKADRENTVAIRDWCVFIYNEAPTSCHGSYDKVDAWKGVNNG